MTKGPKSAVVMDYFTVITFSAESETFMIITFCTKDLCDVSDNSHRMFRVRPECLRWINWWEVEPSLFLLHKSTHSGKWSEPSGWRQQVDSDPAIILVLYCERLSVDLKIVKTPQIDSPEPLALSHTTICTLFCISLLSRHAHRLPVRPAPTIRTRDILRTELCPG